MERNTFCNSLVEAKQKGQGIHFFSNWVIGLLKKVNAAPFSRCHPHHIQSFTYDSVTAANLLTLTFSFVLKTHLLALKMSKYCSLNRLIFSYFAVLTRPTRHLFRTPMFTGKDMKQNKNARKIECFLPRFSIFFIWENITGLIFSPDLFRCLLRNIKPRKQLERKKIHYTRFVPITAHQWSAGRDEEFGKAAAHSCDFNLRILPEHYPQLVATVSHTFMQDLAKFQH